ncbi:MAG TPA: right-handed parallel beta-helix repeat-containing protein [Lacipirellula sp.]
MCFRYFLILGSTLAGSCFAPSAVAQTIIHVSLKGDDAADGTQAHPLRTLHVAQRRARDAMQWDPKGVRVEIAAGRYELPEPLVFTPKDSGRSSELPVTYTAAGGEVIISGGSRLGPWQVDGEVWVADVPAETFKPFRDLWVNGVRAIRARTPNEGYFRVESAGPDNRTSFVVDASDLQTLADPTTAEVAFLHDWSMSRIPLASIDAASRTYTFAAPIGAAQPQFAITNFEPHPRYFLEGAREFLDVPGEWYLDQAAGKLYYLPRPGESPDAAEAIAPRLEQLLIVRGDDDKPVEHLAFEGLTFAHTRFELPPAGYAGVQSSWHSRRSTPDDDAGVTMTSAVLVDHARHCLLLHCCFEHLAACGLHLTRCQDSRIARSFFCDIGGDGLLIGSRDKTDMPLTSNNSVVNCLIEDCGVNFFGAVGLWIGFAQDVNVAHNELRNLPYSGVSLGWQWDDEPTPCRDLRVRLNHIHHVMQQLSDGGGIYTLGRQPGTQLLRNVIHDIPTNAGRAESNGIFMDEGSTDISVERNTIYNIARSPIRFHRAGFNRVVNNRLAAPPGVPIFSLLLSDLAAMEVNDNEQIQEVAWQPAADDPALQAAGLGVELEAAAAATSGE